MLLIKGVTFEEVYECFYNSELNKYGVIQVVRWKSETGERQPRLVKLVFGSNGQKQATLNGRVVYINCFAYRVEEIGGQPIQCRKCHQLGHKEAQCSLEPVCSRCGGEHGRSSCNSAKAKCSNCGGEHSSTYKGCRAFKSAFRNSTVVGGTSSHQVIAGAGRQQSVSVDNNQLDVRRGEFNRLYSTVTRSNRPQIEGTSDLEAIISKAFDKQTTQLNSQIKNLETKIDDVVVKAREVAKDECQHFFNRLLFFVIDCIDLVAPQASAGQEFPNFISNAAVSHGLGNKIFDIRTYLVDKAQRKSQSEKNVKIV